MQSPQDRDQFTAQHGELFRRSRGIRTNTLDAWLFWRIQTTRAREPRLPTPGGHRNDKVISLMRTTSTHNRRRNKQKQQRLREYGLDNRREQGSVLSKHEGTICNALRCSVIFEDSNNIARHGLRQLFG